MGRNPMPFIDLPSDILLRVLSECSVLDILSLSSTCKQLQLMVDEHQVWLHHARHLQVPIPSGTTPSKAELKDWVISRTRVDVCWIKRGPGDVVLHSFETDTKFVDAHLIPGGEFVVLLYKSGDVSLNKIESSEVTNKLDLREVAGYKNGGDHPYLWSELLTETSYGCPVLVWMGAIDWGDPLVFLINPVAQTIEKKRCIRYDLAGVGFSDVYKILAMKDRMFFICDYITGFEINLVAGSGPDQIIRRFHRNFPEDVDLFDMRFFLVSENGLIVCDRLGIHLYHIPELGAVDDGFDLAPIWSWSGDASRYRGSHYMTTSPYHALWLQGEKTTHTLEFDVDESGCLPKVANHHITGGQPAYWVGDHLKLQGRKAMGIDVKERGEAVIKTGVLGKPDLTRQLRASLPGLWDSDSHKQDEVKYTDLDEVTGRIMVVIGTIPGRSQENVPYARRLCLADLPI